MWDENTLRMRCLVSGSEFIEFVLSEHPRVHCILFCWFERPYPSEQMEDFPVDWENTSTMGASFGCKITAEDLCKEVCSCQRRPTVLLPCSCAYNLQNHLKWKDEKDLSKDFKGTFKNVWTKQNLHFSWISRELFVVFCCWGFQLSVGKLS